MAVKGIKGPSKGKAAPSFVLGSRPTTLRASPPPRIKPLLGVRDYGKQGLGGPAEQANPAGASFGDTGQTGMS